MASAQVLPNPNSSRKGHLEAGKRKLEEFRKKRAEGKVKKPASTGQLQSAIVGQYEEQTLESQNMKRDDSDGGATLERNNVSGQPLPAIVGQDEEEAQESQSKRLHDSDEAATSERDNVPGVAGSSTTELSSFRGTHTNPLPSASSHNVYNGDTVQKSEEQASKWYYDSGHQGSRYLSYSHQEEESNRYPSTSHGAQGIRNNEVTVDQPIPFKPVYAVGNTGGNIYQSNHYSMGEGQVAEEVSSLKDATVKGSDTSQASVTSTSPEKSASTPVQHGVGVPNSNTSSLNEDSIRSTSNLSGTFPGDEQYTHADVDSRGSINLDAEERKLISRNNYGYSTLSAPRQSSDSLSTSSSSNFKSSFNHSPQNSITPETGSRRTRPSFLDSLVPRISSASQFPFTNSEKAEPFMLGSSNFQSDVLASSTSGEALNENTTFGSFVKFKNSNTPSSYQSGSYPVSVTNEGEMRSQSMNDNRMEWKHEFPTAKQDENFSALEQHIEDLTQEKFSLQRALDSSRALAESLAAENSSLTDSYNQQGAVVMQLKFELERLQEEIKTNLQELQTIQLEYGNAQLECNAADERAKILASEVISLEEKALKLRSNELKLERQLENSNAEIASYKKKVSSLSKERQDLQHTINALKEEKKLLESKLRKASGSGKSIEVIKTPAVMKDASTSMEDLEVVSSVRGETSVVNMIESSFDHEIQDAASSESREFRVPVASAAIPPDQLRTIGNINSLISELALEKEQLIQALTSESSHSSKLKEMNVELSRKLEAQTQRLELLTAQSMSSENIAVRPTDSQVHLDSTYTDEGDEVVERVLGWIMKLFPGGPSKRRTSKLL